MNWIALATVGVCATVVTGCVSTGTHEKTLGELEEARKTSAQTAAALEGLQQQSAQDITSLEVERGRLTTGILASQRGLEQTQSDLGTTQHRLANEQQARRQVEGELATLREQRDFLQRNVEDLTQRLSTVEQDLAASKEQLGEAHARVAPLELEEARLTNDLSDARDTLAHTQRFLESAERRLAGQERSRREAETTLAQLQEKNRRLQQFGDTVRRERDFYQTTTEDLRQQFEAAPTALAAVEEPPDDDAGPRIAELQRETEEALAALVEAGERGDFLEASLAEEQAKVAGLEEDTQRLMTAARTLEEDGAPVAQAALEPGTDAGRVDDLETQLGKRDREIGDLQLALTQANELKGLLEAQLDQERAAKETEVSILTDTREEQSRLAEMEEAERARLEAELREALDTEIAKGQVRIKQLRDRLMIDVVDRVLFDSGRAQVKPDGVAVLHRVGEILKDVTDKHIRIEGHTDSVPIGPKIIDRFPSNWELSTARATSVVRYLVDKGGLPEANLSAAGYAYNRPVASNDTQEGRAENRRIEIVLYPNDLSDIASF